MKRTFRVWDELNGELDCADEVEAETAQDAAELYTGQDTDGHADGIYNQQGQPIVVTDGEMTWRFLVRVEYTPVYSARLA